MCNKQSSCISGSTTSYCIKCLKQIIKYLDDQSCKITELICHSYLLKHRSDFSGALKKIMEANILSNEQKGYKIEEINKIIYSIYLKQGKFRKLSSLLRLSLKGFPNRLMELRYKYRIFLAKGCIIKMCEFLDQFVEGVIYQSKSKEADNEIKTIVFSCNILKICKVKRDDDKSNKEFFYKIGKWLLLQLSHNKKIKTVSTNDECSTFVLKDTKIIVCN